MLLETGHDSAPARFHSRAELLCIRCASSANRGKRILCACRWRRCDCADNEQYRKAFHNKPRLKILVKKSRSAEAKALRTVSRSSTNVGRSGADPGALPHLLCQECVELTLSVPGMCQFGAGKRYKWLILKPLELPNSD
jgi:hypothetical protein